MNAQSSQHRLKWLAPRPESGRDSLSCAELALQHVSECCSWQKEERRLHQLADKIARSLLARAC